MSRVLDIKKLKVKPTETKKPEMTAEQFLTEIERFMKYDKRYENTTIESTMERIKKIVYVYGIMKPTEESAILIEDGQRKRGNESTTIIHYLKALKIMAEYWNIPISIKMPKVPRKERDYLTPQEARKLIDSAPNVRERAWISLALYCGLRNKEIRHLNIEDIDIKNQIVWIRDRGQHNKNNKDQKVCMTAECTEYIQEWLVARGFIEGNNVCFITLDGNRLSKRHLCALMSTVKKRTNINKQYTVHTLRHSNATNMLNAGIPLNQVSLQLRHASPDITAKIYLHGDYDELKRQIKKLKY